MTDHEKVTMQALEDSSVDFVARLLASDVVRGMNLDDHEKDAIRRIGPLIYIQGAAQVFSTFDCYFKP